jgi:hypothetical protein
MTVPKGQSDREASLIAGEDRRRSQRVIIRIPIVLEVTVAGKEMTLSANTVAVNMHGAMVLSSRLLDAETKLVILNERTHERASARVTRAPRESPEGFLIPLEFDKPAPAFWQITFPPSNWKSLED